MSEIPCTRFMVKFHGYRVYRNGVVIGKRGRRIKQTMRERKGGRFDACVTLYYNGKSKKWTVSRLVAACFLGPIHGYQINHKDRDITNNHVDNLERVTPSENQRHWRNYDKENLLL